MKKRVAIIVLVAILIVAGVYAWMVIPNRMSINSFGLISIALASPGAEDAYNWVLGEPRIVVGTNTDFSWSLGEPAVVVLIVAGGVPEINVDPAVFDFEVVAANSTPNTGNAYFTITNTSTMTIDISIKCDGWAPTVGAGTWTYGSPIGADKAFLKASSADGGIGGSTGEGDYDIVVLNGSDTLLCDGVITTTDPTLELQLNAPSSFTHGDEQETIVTLTAVAE